MTAVRFSHSDIRNIIAGGHTFPWLPSAASTLLRDATCRLLLPRGLSLHSYGTHRFLAGSARACREELFSITVPDALPVIGERLPQQTFRQYEALGLSQIREISGNLCHVRRTIAAAFGYFGVTDSLRLAIPQLVRCVHVVESEDDSYDVSHSDPKVPFSIFLSIPSVHAKYSTIRVCESILHEAMHLQLSLLEGSGSLVSHGEPICFSPWRRELRPPSSVLHGIYVFVCIWVFLELLCAHDPSASIFEYAQRRKCQLIRELTQAFSGLRSSDLTEIGKALVDRLKVCIDDSYR